LFTNKPGLLLTFRAVEHTVERVIIRIHHFLVALVCKQVLACDKQRAKELHVFDPYFQQNFVINSYFTVIVSKITTLSLKQGIKKKRKILGVIVKINVYSIQYTVVCYILKNETFSFCGKKPFCREKFVKTHLKGYPLDTGLGLYDAVLMT
jgi:hypothetical protein